LENPYFHCTSCRIELFGRPEDSEEDGLHQIFRFTGILKNPQGDTEYQTIVATKEHRQGIVISIAQSSYEDFI